MSFQVNIANITLRAITDRDNELLYKMYCSTRMAEMSLMTTWSDLQKENFLRMQFNAQQGYYLQHYPDAYFWKIVKNNKPIGRLYLHEKYQDDSIRIIDITLMPEWRNKGIGKKILLQLLQFAAEKQQAVTLHVGALNPAMHLYQRLGFKVIGANKQHYFMKWNCK